MLRQWVQRLSLQSRPHADHYLSQSLSSRFSTSSIPFRRKDTAGESTEDSPNPEGESIEKDYSHETPKELLDNAAQYNNIVDTPDDMWTKGPYPHQSKYSQSQAKYSKRPDIDPRGTSVILFPGQGTQYVAIQLVKVRAEAMQLASELVPSGMMTVMYGADSRLGFACSVAKEFCQHKELPLVDCRIANYLYPHYFRLRRLKRLPVSGAFHTDLMKPAVAPLQEVRPVLASCKL
ncbi:Malonyl-CoA-acyl carrier protein transacylase, mitochondrial [Portunus trituberculatus]|uniref:Malonyl-CoA-acyl carrier protein transacylase, mitochondrial n=1 Tax=Portunus trituberculatus TaxID=210409 RepID=A0A5B7DNR2_PORTR|nr:Malonyl-CoA-acyl carrier protein transacylase, mitochondrial [Portunus trituberculatus]